jgi:hypothetical protein
MCRSRAKKKAIGLDPDDACRFWGTAAKAPTGMLAAASILVTEASGAGTSAIALTGMLAAASASVR